jgi:cytochrome oxidase Cu insertion factor (SCO1/SenC/PrrC family)
VRKIPDSRNGHRQTIFAGIAILLSALSGIDLAPGSSREDTQARAPFKRVQVGDVAPDFTLRTPDGSSHRLSELRGRKTLVLIFFRGTW